MKKLLFICLFMITANSLLAQNLLQFDQIKLENDEDFKRADSAVLQTANFILSTPIDQDVPTRLKASHFVIKWMEGTPYHTFFIEPNAVRYLSDNVNLMMLYMASMAKYTLQNKATDTVAIAFNGVKILLDYVNNPANNVKKDKLLKRLSDANDKGELKRLLNF